MIRLVNAKTHYKFGAQEVYTKQATMKSPNAIGFDYAIVNEFVEEEPFRITKPQADAMFKNGIPMELLVQLSDEEVKFLHDYKMKASLSYKKKIDDEAKANAKTKTKVVKTEVKKDSEVK